MKHRLRRVLEVASALASATTPDEVAYIVTGEASTIAGAARSLFYVVADRSLHLISQRGLPEKYRKSFSEVERDSDQPVAQATRTKTAVWFESESDDGPLRPFLEAASGSDDRKNAYCAVPLVARGQVLGALVFSYVGPHVFNEFDRDIILTIAHHSGQALARARLQAAERHAQDRFELLARAGEALASSIDLETTLESVVRLTIPQLADVCVFDARDEDGSERRISSPASSPDDTVCSEIVVPVEARGATLGVLTLHFTHSGRRHSAHDVALAEELARRAALAIENARLYRAVRTEHQRLQMALSANGMGAWEWTLASDRVTWSPVLESIHGIPVGTFGGTFAAFQSDIYGEDKGRVLEAFSASVANKDGLQLSYRIVRPDGEVRWLTATGTVSLDSRGDVIGMVGVCADVTEQRRAEQDRKRTEEVLLFLGEVSAVLGSSLDYENTLDKVASLAVPRLADWLTIDTIERDGKRKRLASAQVDPPSGKPCAPSRATADAVARGVAHVVRTGCSEVIADLNAVHLAGSASDREMVAFARAAGLTSWMCIPLRVRGETCGAMTFFFDETSGRRYETNDLRLAEELGHLVGVAIENAYSFRDAQNANRLKDEFLATVSHELRTPLNAILGWAVMLRTTAPTPEAQRRALETIERNARAQARLIEDVLDVSRIIAGNLRLAIRQTEMSAVVKLAVEVIEPMAHAKGVALDLAIDDGVGSISGDADRLQQVIWNLVSNAVKFTAKGGRVLVAAERTGVEVVVRVSDTGEGIGVELLPYVFDRFRQADSSSTRKQGGLGLGLAIARHLTELHGGTIRAQSDGIGTGATFTVTLPVRAAPTASSSPPTSASPSSPPPPPKRANAVDLRAMRILVCDDEPDARELLSMVLSKHGAEVRAVASAAEALSVLAELTPHVIVSDIGMPEVDGYALMQAVRKLTPEQGSTTPALALTAFARAEDAKRAFAAGYQLHLTKPVDPATLVASVGNLCGRVNEQS